MFCVEEQQLHDGNPFKITIRFVSCQPTTHDATCLQVFSELCRCRDKFDIVNLNCVCVEEESSLI